MEHEEFLQKLTVSELSDNCSILKALELLNRKWRTYVLYVLCRQPSLRFGEIKRQLPYITNTMLTCTLRDLEEFGIVTRKQFNEIPPHVEYSLTESGKALLPVFYEIAKWSESYLKTVDKSTSGESGCTGTMV